MNTSNWDKNNKTVKKTLTLREDQLKKAIQYQGDRRLYSLSAAVNECIEIATKDKE